MSGLLGADLIRTKGIGTQRRARSPSTVDAHRGFSAVYILLANNYRGRGLVSNWLRVPIWRFCILGK